MSITKIAKMTTEITADYQKLSDLNVAFYNQDVNTSILQFNMTRNNAPVPLGKVNVDGYIVLLAADGSRIQDTVEIVDELKGVIQYTIPKEFLKHSGKALGQIYIAVKGKDDTAVMRQFSFDIKNDLLTSFSAAIKLEYIKTFDDLTTFIKQRVDEIDAAIANGEDYVTAMEKASEKGQKDIQAVATKATTDINKVSADASKKITDTSNTAVATVNAKGDAVLDAINTNDVVKIADAANWQKYKITEDRGSSISVIGYDLLNTDDIKNFNGYVATVKNAPEGVADRGHLERTYYSKSITLTYTPYNENSIYSNVHDFSKKIWLGWEKIVTASEITTIQKQKITADNGAPLYDLNASKDLFAEILTWGNGFFTFYLSAGATNNPTGNTSWLRGTASTYGKNSNVLAYDKDGAMYTAVCANGVWRTWGKAQMYKTTEDDGSSLTLANYDLLNTTDVYNFDGYVTTATNSPTVLNNGYFKRKYRSGYIEVAYSPYNANTTYRNAYNFGNKSWYGWEKISTSQTVTLWEGSANGASSAVYTLSRAVNLNRKIRVTFNFVGGDGLTSTFDFKTSRVATFNNFNISDATAIEPALYELQLDFTSLTGFTIKLDNLHNLVTGAGSINRKAYTVIRVEEVD